VAVYCEQLGGGGLSPCHSGSQAQTINRGKWAWALCPAAGVSWIKRMEGDAPAIQQPPNHPSPLVQWAKDCVPMYTIIDCSVGMHNGQLALYTLSAVGR